MARHISDKEVNERVKQIRQLYKGVDKIKIVIEYNPHTGEINVNFEPTQPLDPDVLYGMCHAGGKILLTNFVKAGIMKAPAEKRKLYMI